MFPRKAEQSRPVGLVHDRENASPAAKELMFRNVVDLEPFRRWRYVVEGDVEGRRHGGERVEHVFGEVGRKVLWYLVDVVGVPACLHQRTESRGLESCPGMSDGRSRYRSLS